MYERTSNSGHTVEWNPEHSDHAAAALAKIDGTGVDSEADAKQGEPVEVDQETSRRVREDYRKRLVEAGVIEPESTGAGP